MFDQAFITTLAKQVAALVAASMPTPRVEPWPKWMNTETAARYVGLNKDQFRYAFVEKKLVPIVRRDRLLLIDRDDIDTALTKLKR